MYNYDPYEFLSPVPNFTLTSGSFADGDAMPPAQVNPGAHADGKDLSPALKWSGFPAETKSFAITMFDPDAPTASGWWHWSVANVPVQVTELSEGAGSGPSTMPTGSLLLRNDAGTSAYMGSAPPPGHGPHRYMVVVHAVDISTLDLNADSTPAALGFNLAFHTLARARITATFEV